VFRCISGTTLVEALLVMALIGVLATVSAAGTRRLLDGIALRRAATVVRGELGRARLMAAARRQSIRVRVWSDGDIVLLSPTDSVLSRAGISSGGPFHVDSVRLRPSTLRFNSRGQASPGSAYLYRGAHGIRLVSNFIGRVRSESF